MILIKVPDARREVLHILTSQMLERRPDTGQAIGGIRHLMAHYQQTYELSKAQATAMFQPLLEIEQHVLKGLGLSEEILERYFSPPGDGEWCPGSILAHANGQPLGVEEACAFVLLLISDDQDGIVGVLPMVQFLQALQTQDLSNDLRWQLAELCSDWSRHQALVEEILTRGAALYAQALPAAQALIDNWYEALAPKLAAGTLSIAPLRMADLQDFTLRPALFSCNAISLCSFNPAAQNLPRHTPTISYGVLYDQLGALRDAKQQDDAQLVQALKALGDKQRMRIFRALQRSPCYGTELALLTGLSPATISHHMTELLQANLVTLELSGQRSVYHVNPEGVQNLAAAIATLNHASLN